MTRTRKTETLKTEGSGKSTLISHHFIYMNLQKNTKHVCFRPEQLDFVCAKGVPGEHKVPSKFAKTSSANVAHLHISATFILLQHCVTSGTSQRGRLLQIWKTLDYKKTQKELTGWTFLVSTCGKEPLFWPCAPMACSLSNVISCILLATRLHTYLPCFAVSTSACPVFLHGFLPFWVEGCHVFFVAPLCGSRRSPSSARKDGRMFFSMWHNCIAECESDGPHNIK